MADLLDSPQEATNYAATIQRDMAQLLKDTVEWKAFPTNVAAGLADQWKVQQTMIDSNVGQIEVLMQLLGNGGNEIGIQLCQQHQWSRGTLFITSTNPFDSPAINPDYFGVGYDIDILNNAVAFARRLAKAGPLANVLLSEKTPGAGVTGEALNDYLKRTAVTEYHPMGTCSMMPRDKGGVVDTNLVVYGTSNIRVIDCSIMPLQISAHLMATGYGIAEKGAEIIQSKYTLQAQQVSSSSSSAGGSATGAASSAGASATPGAAGLNGANAGSTTKSGLSQAAVIGIGVGGAALLAALVSVVVVDFFIARSLRHQGFQSLGLSAISGAALTSDCILLHQEEEAEASSK
jgi:choline dehydrogenase